MMSKIWARWKPTSSYFRSISYVSRPRTTVMKNSGKSATSWCSQLNNMTTLFYSSIFTVGAVIDARVKRKRREDWDRVIGDAERSLIGTEAENSRLSEVLSEEAKHDRAQKEEYPWEMSMSAANMGSSSELTKGLNQVCNSSMNAEESTDEIGSRVLPSSQGWLQDIYDTDSRVEKLQELKDEVFRSLHTTTDRPIRSSETRSRVSSSSIYASDFRRSRRKYFWTPKKLVTVELSVSKLASKLLLQVQPENQRKPSEKISSIPSPISCFQDDHDLRVIVASASAKLRQVQNADTFRLDGIERAQYPHYTPNADPSTDAAVELNRALRKNFSRHALGQLSLQELISKVSYNLLISPAPPDVKTYTILLSRLSRLQQYPLADIIIESLFESHLRPDEMTVATILTHYTRKHDFNAFDEFVKIMRGYHGGLMLARPDIKTDGVAASRLRRWNDKIIQRITLDGPIFVALIEGYLSFGKLRDALSWYRLMRKQKIVPALKIMTSFLRFFAETNDWIAGMGMWHSITSGFLSRSMQVLTTRSESATAYFSVLQLCKNCRKSLEFKSIYEDGLRRGLPMDWMLVKKSERRGFTDKDDAVEWLKRRVRILEYRVFLIELDIQNWALQVLAAKIILLGHPLETVKQAFAKYGNRASYKEWLRNRRYTFRTRKYYQREHTGMEPIDVIHGAERLTDTTKVDHTRVENSRLPPGQLACDQSNTSNLLHDANIINAWSADHSDVPGCSVPRDADLSRESDLPHSYIPFARQNTWKDALYTHHHQYIGHPSLIAGVA